MKKRPAKKQQKLNYEPTQVERNIQLETVYKKMLPHLGDHGGKLVAAHIILILKLEGVIGETLTDDDMKMVEEIKEKLLGDPVLRKETLANIEKIMGKSVS